jgi:hypothetical protein
MDNVQMIVEGNILTITVDLSKELGASKTGKTISIASTKGNKQLTEKPGVYVGVNVYKYPDEKKTNA